MSSADLMIRYACNLIQRGDREEMARYCEEERRNDVIRAELNVPREIEVFRAEQSTKH